jgi:hypothetical protein
MLPIITTRSDRGLLLRRVQVLHRSIHDGAAKKNGNPADRHCQRQHQLQHRRFAAAAAAHGSGPREFRRKQALLKYADTVAANAKRKLASSDVKEKDKGLGMTGFIFICGVIPVLAWCVLLSFRTDLRDQFLRELGLAESKPVEQSDGKMPTQSLLRSIYAGGTIYDGEEKEEDHEGDEQ